jgi:hypothetical protein
VSIITIISKQNQLQIIGRRGSYSKELAYVFLLSFLSGRRAEQAPWILDDD